MKTLQRFIIASLLCLGVAPAFAQAPPPVPALPDTERRTSYSISSSTCACAVGFQLYGDGIDYQNWVEVFVNGVKQTGNWTITSPTGQLSVIPRPITDAVLTFTAAQTGTVQIVGARRPRRASQISENRGVSARDFNQIITDLTAMLRESWDKTNDVTGRTVQARPGETLALLPALAARMNMGACFDSSGNLTACSSIPTGTFAAGAGIAFTGSSPTSISADVAAGADISITGTHPVVIASTNPSRSYASSVALAAASVPASATIVQTLGGTVVGDSPAALRVRSATLPTHSCYVQSADGAYWPLAQYNVTPEMCGGKGDGVTDDSAAINNEIEYLWAQYKGGRIEFLQKTYATANPILVRPQITLRGQVAGGGQGANLTGKIVYSGTSNAIIGKVTTAAIPYVTIENLAISAPNSDGPVINGLSFQWAQIRNNTISANSSNVSIGIQVSSAIQSANITGISKANPGVVTAPAHGFSNGDTVAIASVVGMTQVNSRAFVVSGATTNTFQIGQDTTGYSTYVSGGASIRQQLQQDHGQLHRPGQVRDLHAGAVQCFGDRLQPYPAGDVGQQQFLHLHRDDVPELPEQYESAREHLRDDLRRRDRDFDRAARRWWDGDQQ
jgi:hypothetical protein